MVYPEIYQKAPWDNPGKVMYESCSANCKRVPDFFIIFAGVVQW